jgi:Resolvase, N terminal domain
MQPLHAAIYARVSSDQQTADKTIASQLATLEARLAREGLRVAPEHRFVDEGYSGATLVRPGPSSACATRPPRARSIVSTSTRPTGWRAATPTRSS